MESSNDLGVASQFHHLSLPQLPYFRISEAKGSGRLSLTLISSGLWGGEDPWPRARAGGGQAAEADGL